jgi:hypothetical protein
MSASLGRIGYDVTAQLTASWNSAHTISGISKHAAYVETLCTIGRIMKTAISNARKTGMPKVGSLSKANAQPVASATIVKKPINKIIHDRLSALRFTSTQDAIRHIMMKHHITIYVSEGGRHGTFAPISFVVTLDAAKIASGASAHMIPNTKRNLLLSGVMAVLLIGASMVDDETDILLFNPSVPRVKYIICS